jgi:hypothetical protein
MKAWRGCTGDENEPNKMTFTSNALRVPPNRGGAFCCRWTLLTQVASVKETVDGFYFVPIIPTRFLGIET